MKITRDKIRILIDMTESESDSLRNLVFDWLDAAEQYNWKRFGDCKSVAKKIEQGLAKVYIIRRKPK